MKSFIQLPLMILCKSSIVLEDEHYSQIIRLSWQLLLDRNEELASCAGKFEKSIVNNIFLFAF